MDPSQLPTFGQLERKLSQSIQKLYREELEHWPQKVICKFSSNHLSIVIEDALTAVEETLVNEDGVNKTVKSLNVAINDAIESKLKKTVEAILAVEVVDVLFDCNIETKRAGAIIMLSQLPKARSSTRAKAASSKAEENADGKD